MPVSPQRAQCKWVAFPFWSSWKDVLDLRSSGWEDNKVVVVSESSGGFRWFRWGVLKWKGAAMGSYGHLTRCAFWGNKKIGGSEKAWRIRGKKYGTSAEFCCVVPFLLLALWEPCDLRSGVKTLHIQCIRDYRSINHIQWISMTILHVVVFCPDMSREHRHILKPQINSSDRMLFSIFDLLIGAAAKVTSPWGADIGCPTCDPDIFPLKICMNRQCMKSCRQALIFFSPWLHVFVRSVGGLHFVFGLWLFCWWLE